ncbi:MAG: flagellar export chaperone FliS [Thermodesulfobacteriota bacterium]|nr:flagellar export chaperone FliS [Thermodesulfobacteriota bacterium]
MANINSALSQYNQVAGQVGLDDVDSHRLVQLLFEGSLNRIAEAKGHMLRGEIAEKGTRISKAISIVESLRTSLDKGAGGEIAEHLDNLYEYICKRLLEANMTNNPQLLDEAAELLGEVKSAWGTIPEELR